MINEPIDFYDDCNGNVIKQVLPDHGGIPEFIKTAERLTPEELNKLPDNVFALVAFDGTDKMRKFACVDKGNVALSVIYFMENKDKMPAEAQKTAAINLKRACDWYNLQPPEELSKIALLGAVMPIVGAGMTLSEGHKSFKRRKAAMQSGMRPSKAMTKVQELYGSHQMPVSKPVEKTAGILQPESPRAKEVVKGRGPEARAKRALIRDKLREGCPAGTALDPYVDITGKKPPVKLAYEKGKYFCLNGKYPIDTVGQVEKAASYFEYYGDHFTPFERHQYCVKLAARADDLGMTLPEDIQRYGSTKTAQDACIGIYQRQRLFREGTSERSLLDEMREKYAAIKPEVMAKVLEDFDRSSGIDALWGEEIPDPYFTMFGKEKRAEWSFSHGNDYINEERLLRCAKESKKEIEDLFGREVAEEFSSRPKQIFDSLPLNHKRIIMRISQAVEE